MPSDGAAELLFFCLRTLAGKYSLSCFLYKNKAKQKKNKTRKQHRYKYSQLQFTAIKHVLSWQTKDCIQKICDVKRGKFVPILWDTILMTIGHLWLPKTRKNFHFSYNFRLALSEAMISDKKGQKFKPKTNKVTGMLWKSKWPMDYKSHRLKSQNMICIEIESENKVFIWGAYHLHKPPGWKSFV